MSNFLFVIINVVITAFLIHYLICKAVLQNELYIFKLRRCFVCSCSTHVSTIERLTVSRGGNRSRLLTLSIIHGRVSSTDRPIKYFIRDKVVWNVHVCWSIDVTAKCRRRSLKHIVFKHCDFSLSLAETPIILLFDWWINHSTTFVLHLSKIINNYISLTRILFCFVVQIV